ncbi:hypothetical protein PSAC2689_210048 [Paraburkholderia sacchari]
MYRFSLEERGTQLGATDVKKPAATGGLDAKRLILLNSLGWLMGLEPTTTGITILDSTN